MRDATAPRWSSRSTASPAPTSGWSQRGPACRALAESATRGGARHVIVQEYLSSVADGNKRLFLVDGEIIGAVLRRPSADDFRIGPPVAAAAVDAADRRIVGALAPLLGAHGIALAGLDVIDGRLIEVNVTCPGGMHKADALLGTDLSGVIVRRLLDPPPSPRGTPLMTTIPVVCIALMGIMLFLLGANVTRHRAIRGDDRQPDAERPRGPDVHRPAGARQRQRVHPHPRGADRRLRHADRRLVARRAGIAAAASRWLHAVGMLTSKTLAVTRAGPGLRRDGHLPHRGALGVTALVAL